MAITQATSLADFSTGIGTAGAVLQVDNVDQRIGIGTTDPQGTLQVGIAITMDGTAGVITASSFSGSGGNLTFTGADISAATASFTGNVSVGGTLTYEDVTNIDAVGIITARSDVSIADKIVHTGDTNTAIRFPAADTFTVETGGSERVRVTSAGKFGVGLTPSMFFEVLSDENDIARFSGPNSGGIVFRNDTSNEVQIHTGTSDALIFGTNGENERLRITSAGDFGYGTSSPGCFFEVSKDDSGATVQQKLLNRSTDANSSSNNFIYVNGAAAGDPFTTWTVGGVTSWSMGIDNSDSDKLVINNGSNLSSNLISVDTSGNVTLTANLDLQDSDKILLGTGDDLEIYHDGTDNLIKSNAALKIQGAGSNSYTVHISARTDKETIKCYNNTNAPYVELFYDNSKKLETSSAGVTVTGTVSDSIGDLRSIPLHTQSSNASYTLQASDAGKTIHVHTTTTTVVVPNSVFSAGDAVSIVNGDGSNTPTISQGSGFSLRNTGDGTTGNRTLGVFGMATIYFTGAGVGYISGSGMT